MAVEPLGDILAAADAWGAPSSKVRLSLKIRRYNPDWVVTWNLSAMHVVAAKEMKRNGIPMDKLISVNWLNEVDIANIGAEEAKGIKRGTNVMGGKDHPLMQQIQKLREVVFADGHLNKDVVGKTAREIGALAGIDVPASARIILLPAKGAGTADILAKEKLCPVVAILPYKTFKDAVAAAKANLTVEGAGHSAALHCRSWASTPARRSNVWLTSRCTRPRRSAVDR